jgi:hypothetical protein
MSRSFLLSIGIRVIACVIFSLLAPPSTSASPPKAIPISARVSMHLGRPTPLINNRPVQPMIYALTDVPGGRWSWEELARHNIRSFYEEGITLFQVDLSLEHILLENGRFDITLARKQISGIREVNPDAAVFIRFHVTPPKWWMRRHPEEWVQYADTEYQEESPDGFPRIIEEDNFPVRRVSMASQVWKREAARHLKRFLSDLAKAPEGNGLAGVQVADGIYGEWHNWGFFRNEPDIGTAMTRHFRGWLREQYGDDKRLRQAWHLSTAAIDSTSIPGVAERRTPGGILRNPEKEQQVIDYYRCVHELVADNILFYARIVKESWPRPIIVGTFYGYYFSTFGRQAAGGHLELHRVLSSPYVDYLSGPQAYEPASTKLGDPYRSRGLLESIRLHGKLWLDEMDNEPTIPTSRDANYAKLLQNAIANVRRNVSFTYTKGMGLWFYDFGVAGVDLDGFRYNHRGSRGNWDHPDVLRDIGRIKKVFESRSQAVYTTDADVLFVYDTESFYHTASLRGTDPVSNILVDYNTMNAFRAGVVFDAIHVRDLERINLAQYRVIVFGNTFVLTSSQRQFIRTRVAHGGRTLVWFYAPGYSDATTLNVARIAELTGIRIAPTTQRSAPVIVLALPHDTTTTYTVGKEPLGPLFRVDDSEAEPYGRYAESGEVAVARKRMPDHTSWYVALPNTGLEPMGYILQNSDAHVYSYQGDVVYSGGGILVVHTKDGGKRTVTLKGGTVREFELPSGASTLILDSKTGEDLMTGER